MTARGGTLDSFRVRSFRLFFAGQLVSQIGTWMRQIAATLLVLDLTHDGIAVGLLTACQFLPMLLLGPWAGVVADRSSKRRLLLRVEAALLLQSVGLAVLAFADDPPLLGIYAVTLYGGLALAFENPLRRSFVVEMVPPSAMQNAVALNSALMTSARIVGPAVAGLLIGTVGFAWCFVVDAVSFLAVLASLALMRTSELWPARPATRGGGQVREGLRYVRGDPVLWTALCMVALVGTLAFNFPVVLPLFVSRSLGSSPSAYSGLFSVLSIGSMCAAVWSSRRRSISLRDISIGAAGFAVAMALVGASPTLALAHAAALTLGFTSIQFITGVTTLIQLRAEQHMRGRVLALQAMVMNGSTPIGGPLLGIVCEVAGPRAGLGVGAAACVVAATYGALVARDAALGAAVVPAPIGDPS